MADLEYTEAPLAYRRRDDAGQVELGAVVDGAFIAFASLKAGGFDDDVHEAQQAADAKKTVEAQQAQGSSDNPAPPQV